MAKFSLRPLTDEQAQFLERSNRFILSNPHITTNLIPDEFLNRWVTYKEDTYSIETELSDRALGYGLVAHLGQQYMNSAPAQQQALLKFLRTKVAYEHLCRSVGYKLNPVKLFDFSDIESARLMISMPAEGCDILARAAQKYEAIDIESSFTHMDVRR